MNPLSDLKDLRAALEAENDVLFAYLFGSQVQSQAAPLSDVDVAIYPAKTLSMDDRLGIIQRVSKNAVLNNLDVTFLDRLENLYLLDAIVAQGVVLLDRDPDRRELFEVRAQHRFFDFQYQRKLYFGA